MEFLPLIIVIVAVILIKRKISKSNFKFLETFKAQQKTKRSQIDYETQALEDFMQDFENEDPDAILLAYVTAASRLSPQDPALKEMRDKYPFLKEQFTDERLDEYPLSQKLLRDSIEETNITKESEVVNSEEIQQINFCSACGRKIERDDSFCSSCGKDLR